MSVGCRHACYVTNEVIESIFERKDLSEAEFSGQLRSTKLSLFPYLSVFLQLS